MEIDSNYSKISVIIPCFNSQNSINRCLNSVCMQTKKPYELIVIDDASTDKTLEFLNKFAQKEHDFKVTILKNNLNLGPGISRNLGWDTANGNWVSFLDADDSWLENKISTQIEYSRKLDSVDILSFKSIHYMNQDHKAMLGSEKIKKLGFKKALFRNQVVTRTTSARKSISNRFPSGLSEDYGLWLECLSVGLNVYKVDKVVALTYRREYSKGGLSSKLLKHELFEMKRLGTYMTKSPILVTSAILFSVGKFVRRILISISRNFNND
jgi:teichuronic acid biosynthesis glycosyltransferase TuaG